MMLDMAKEDRQFDAALQGVDLGEGTEQGSGGTGGLAARLRGDSKPTGPQLQGFDVREV